MSNPTWFNQEFYLQNKAAALNAAGTGGHTDWTAAQVLQSMQAAGITPYEHYTEYGAGENLSPNPSFDPTYYLQQKATQLNAHLQPGQMPYTTTTVLQAILNSGMTPMDHYEQFGASESLNPNTYFDQSYYLNAKVAELNAAQTGGRTDWTAAEVLQSIENSGMTPYDHFAQYGVNEGLNPSASFDVQAYLQSKANELNQSGGTTTWTPATVLATMQQAGLDPITHYVEYGHTEEIPVTPVTPENPGTPGGGGGGGGGGTTFTVTNNTGTLAFGGTATGDVTFTVASDGTATFTRSSVIAATTLAVAAFTSSGGTPIKLSADATNLSVANATALTSITGYDANGHTYTLADTIANLTGHTAGASGYSVVDTAANLVTGAPGAIVTGASAVKLSANATDLSTADATTLTGITGYSANGHTFTVLDTAANIIANHSYVGASAYKLSADATNLLVADATTLTGLTGFNANTHTYSINDSILAADTKDFSTGWNDLSGVTLTGSVGDQSVTGSSHADVIAGGTGADTITGGAGIDEFVYSAGDSTLASMDTITDYRAAGGANAGAADTISLQGISALISTTNSVIIDATNDLSAGSVSEALDALASSNVTTNGVSVFLYGGDTYVYVESDNTGLITTYNASDTVIKLTGTLATAGTNITGLGINNL